MTIAISIRNAYEKYAELCNLNSFNSVMAMTIKLPNALLQNQAAVITDRIENGDCVNENDKPGIERVHSPSIINRNCGNCHNIDHCSPLFVWRDCSIFTCKSPAQKNARTALKPPMAMLCSGDIRMLYTSSAGITTFCQIGIKIRSNKAPTAFAWSASIR